MEERKNMIIRQFDNEKKGNLEDWNVGKLEDGRLETRLLWALRSKPGFWRFTLRSLRSALCSLRYALIYYTYDQVTW